MKLSIVKPTGTEIMDVDWIEVPTDNGKFIVESEHMPMIVFLNSKERVQLKLKDEVEVGSVIDLPNYGGIVKIDRDQVVLIITQEIK